jgi:hypothetical protein
VDEIDATVDAVDRPISVGHGAPPGRVGSARCACGGRPDRQSGKARSGETSRAPATQVPMSESLLRGAPVLMCGAGYNASENGTSQPPTGWRA